MESKQKYTKEDRNDINILKNIVNMVVVTDIMSNNRRRYVVEGRMIYAKILREYGYSLNRIGSSINKDHTTIIHYEATMHKLMKTDPEIVRKYNKCKDIFLLEKGPDSKLTTEAELKNEIFRLNTKIDFLIGEKESLKKQLSEFKKDVQLNEKRLGRIVKFIDENTPVGHEYITERKIRKLFDE